MVPLANIDRYFGFLLILVPAAPAAAQNERPLATSLSPREPELRDELLARSARDQEVRMTAIKFSKQRDLRIGSSEFAERGGHLLEEMERVDAENLEWFKRRVEQHGWPGKTLVGTDGAGAAFLLVQHATSDRPFQKHCLKLMQAADDGEVASDHVALLTDRIRLAEGEKQVYGTQVELRDGEWHVQGEVEDPSRLDERRQRVGLPPVADYLRQVAELYGSPTDDAHSTSTKEHQSPTGQSAKSGSR